MALCKDAYFIFHSEDEVFDTDLRPGSLAPRSGIYRCMGCGREVAVEQIERLPPRNHHRHTRPGEGAVRWRLIVYADHRPA
jgi:hypothetical protein